jgi:hypothetical protein
MTILSQVFGQQGKIQFGVFSCYSFSFSLGKLLLILISFWILGKCLDSLSMVGEDRWIYENLQRGIKKVQWQTTVLYHYNSTGTPGKISHEVF